MGFLGGSQRNNKKYRTKQDEYKAIIFCRRFQACFRRCICLYAAAITIVAFVLFCYILVGPSALHKLLPFIANNTKANSTNLTGLIEFNPSNNTILCNKIGVHKIWHKGFEKFTSKSEVNLIDVNGDAILDIIIGFGTGILAVF